MVLILNAAFTVVHVIGHRRDSRVRGGTSLGAWDDIDFLLSGDVV